MKYIITLIGTLFAFVITAEEMETIASLTKKISQAEIEKRKMDKENPCVVYAEEAVGQSKVRQESIVQWTRQKCRAFIFAKFHFCCFSNRQRK